MEQIRGSPPHVPIEDQAYQAEAKSHQGPSLRQARHARGAAVHKWGSGEGLAPSYLSKYTKVNIVGRICMPGPRRAG